MLKKLFFTQLAWDNKDDADLLSSIKLLSLINHQLVIPSNQTYSLRAEELFRTHPELLTERILIPALPDKHPSFSSYFEFREGKAMRSLKSYGEFLDSLDCTVDLYPASAPAQIFSDHVISQLSDPDSVVSKAGNISRAESEALIVALNDVRKKSDGNAVTFRPFLSCAASTLSTKAYQAVETYANLLRHISGAASKNCNNHLPQENLVNWSLANPENPSEFLLNDEQLFWEVFLESLIRLSDNIFSLDHVEKLSPRIMDRLSVRDISDLRKDGIYLEQFLVKYETLINQVNGLRANQEDNHSLLDFESLIAKKEYLSEIFSQALKVEIETYQHIEVFEASMKVAYSLLGGTLSKIQAVVNYFSIMINKKKKVTAFTEKQSQRFRRAAKYAAERYSDQPVLIEYMDRIAQKAKENWHA